MLEYSDIGVTGTMFSLERKKNGIYCLFRFCFFGFLFRCLRDKRMMVFGFWIIC